MGQRDYVFIFLANSGPQPWTCHFCGEDVVFILRPGRGGNGRSLHVHHLDGDHGNDVIENLVPSHGSCHQRWHMSQPGAKLPPVRQRGQKFGPHSPEHRAKISEALRGRTISEVQRKAVGDAHRGRPKPETQRKAMSESAKKAWAPGGARRKAQDNQA